jgi:hypothetical protein
MSNEPDSNSNHELDYENGHAFTVPATIQGPPDIESFGVGNLGLAGVDLVGDAWYTQQLLDLDWLNV